MAVDQQIHDYTRRVWGHDYVISTVIDGGRTLRLMGWGRGIRSGDHLLLQNGEDSTRYLVESVEYLPDPPDMWRIVASFAPRELAQVSDGGGERG